jgi:hypothetical protein
MSCAEAIVEPPLVGKRLCIHGRGSQGDLGCEICGFPVGSCPGTQALLQETVLDECPGCSDVRELDDTDLEAEGCFVWTKIPAETPADYRRDRWQLELLDGERVTVERVIDAAMSVRLPNVNGALVGNLSDFRRGHWQRLLPDG